MSRAELGDASAAFRSRRTCGSADSPRCLIRNMWYSHSVLRTLWVADHSVRPAVDKRSAFASCERRQKSRRRPSMPRSLTMPPRSPPHSPTNNGAPGDSTSAMFRIASCNSFSGRCISALIDQPASAMVAAGPVPRSDRSPRSRKRRLTKLSASSEISASADMSSPGWAWLMTHQQSYSAPDSFWHIAFDGDVPVSAACGFRTGDTGGIYSVATPPEFRGQGSPRPSRASQPTTSSIWESHKSCFRRANSATGSTNDSGSRPTTTSSDSPFRSESNVSRYGVTNV